MTTLPFSPQAMNGRKSYGPPGARRNVALVAAAGVGRGAREASLGRPVLKRQSLRAPNDEWSAVLFPRAR
jgi:hypothetical protein